MDSKFHDTSFTDFQNLLNSNFGDLDFYNLYSQNLVPEDIYKKVLSIVSFRDAQNQSSKVSGLFEPAKTLKKSFSSLKPKYHVVIVPGIFTSGLENWHTEGCMNSFFRRRIWGSTSMFNAILANKQCWMKNMLLDEESGLDPPGTRVRATIGLEAVEYFMTGYWVWAKIIDNLSEIGYDNQNMHVASYDWRLAFSDLETRDSYFTNLKIQIESFKRVKKEKTVLVSHSM
ncbi:Phospholipid:diacylglycerol acyltransferase, partial [Smittium mucronatum]